MQYSEQVQTVIDILQNEADGDVKSALKKMTEDYSMTWVYEGRDGELFPHTEVDMEAELDDVYHIKGRQYDIRNIAESENVVMIEMVESYPDPKTGQVYRTPQVIVLEFTDGKIRTGRHYCDPRLSFKELTNDQIDLALRDTNTKFTIRESR
jgi:ketosteroid isomerase-like protein